MIDDDDIPATHAWSTRHTPEPSPALALIVLVSIGVICLVWAAVLVWLIVRYPEWAAATGAVAVVGMLVAEVRR